MHDHHPFYCGTLLLIVPVYSMSPIRCTLRPTTACRGSSNIATGLLLRRAGKTLTAASVYVVICAWLNSYFEVGRVDLDVSLSISLGLHNGQLSFQHVWPRKQRRPAARPVRTALPLGW